MLANSKKGNREKRNNKRKKQGQTEKEGGREGRTTLVLTQISTTHTQDLRPESAAGDPDSDRAQRPSFH